jgi:membrane protein insertase Oxa1/YidC/SpoIIIJ
MISTYIYLISILALLIIIGLKLRSAGKDLENKNLTQAGTMWLIVNGGAIIFTLIMIVTTLLKGSEICNCSDIYLGITKEAKAANNNQKKIDAIQKKYKSDIEMCEKIFSDKTKDQATIEKELDKCPSYKKLKKMQN